jgi:hypothetical protein
MEFTLLGRMTIMFAHIAMGRLEEDNIRCWLKDENTVTIDPILTNAVGGIKLMVESGQAERAAGILRCRKANTRPYILVEVWFKKYRRGKHTRKASNWASAIIGLLYKLCPKG